MRDSADLLAALLSAGLAFPVPSAELRPPPGWAYWDHAEAGLWPVPDDAEVDLNAQPVEWLDGPAAEVRRVLLGTDRPERLGHVDWLPQNVWWNEDGSPHVVHDWDSLL